MADDSTIPQFNLQALNLVDEICDEFESIWKTGSTPSIAEYLKKTAPDLRPTLFEQLVRVDIDYRRSLGEVPFAEEYVENFPQFRPLLDSIEGLSFCDQTDRLKLLRDIGPLRLLHEIGSGTFGVVWKAHDWNLDRTVAVKLPKSLTLNREHAMSFRHEAKAAAKLNHPGIVRVLSFGLHEGIAYIVYDLVDGLTLKQWATQNSVTPEQAAEICALLADALQHAHDNGVIHRDLKPGNILIEDKTGQPKITDFGLAKRTDSGSTITSYGAIIGTLAYLSPEQASSQHDDLDGRTDIYSLGVILYELLTGRIPFSGSRPEVINKILSSAPAKISPSENIPPRLEQICLKCLAKTVDQRYATARDLADDLREFLSGNNSPLTIKKENSPPRTIGTIVAGLRHWLAAGSRTTLLLTLVPIGLVLMAWWSTRRGEESPIATALNSTIAEIVPAKPSTVILKTKPRGSIVSWVLCDPQTGEPDLQQLPGTTAQSLLPLHLPPGLYMLQVTSGQPEDLITHRVFRTVPLMNTMGQVAAWQSSKRTDNGNIEWPEISVPLATITNSMVYIPGNNNFVIEGPDGPVTYAVAPFYVSPREFTLGDFALIREGELAPDFNKSAETDPADTPMPSRYDLALHWAEASGGRLLTDLEFTYLTHLATEYAASASGQSTSTDKSPDNQTSDAFMVGDAKIEGILSGLAEWTLTWPTSPNSSVLKTNSLPKNMQPREFRIIRGGTRQSSPQNQPVSRDEADVGIIHEYYPGVGFRIACSAPPRPQ